MDVMKGDPSLIVWDIHIEEDAQRKGLGKHLMMILDLVARRAKMAYISVPVQVGRWIHRSNI